MSRDWTPEELQAASEAMKAAGHMGYEEFCEKLESVNPAPDPDIEGLKELRAARSAWVNYHVAKTKFERGEIDYEDVPAYNPDLCRELEKKYPRADVYLQAEAWITSGKIAGEPIKIRLGTRGMEKIRNGEDPAEVLAYMKQELDAFRMAQEG